MNTVNTIASVTLGQAVCPTEEARGQHKGTQPQAPRQRDTREPVGGDEEWCPLRAEEE